MVDKHLILQSWKFNNAGRFNKGCNVLSCGNFIITFWGGEHELTRLKSFFFFFLYLTWGVMFAAEGI